MTDRQRRRAGLMRTTVLIGALTLAARSLSTIKEVVVAARFGVGDTIDTFVIALAVFSFIDAVLIQSITSAFLPAYVQRRASRDHADARSLFAALLGRSMLAAAIAALILYLSAGALFDIVATGFDAAKRDQAKVVFWILLPALVFQCISTATRAVLNTADRFATPALTPAAVPVATLLVIAIAGPSRFVLPVAATIGFAVEAMILLAFASSLGLLVRPRLRGSTHLTDVVRQYWPAVGAALLMGSSALVDNAMATTEPDGSAAMFSYGSRVVSFVLGVSAVAVGTAVLPYYSTLVADNRWTDIANALRFQVKVLLAVAIPPTVAVALASEPIVRTLFERGEFTAADTATVADVQALLVLQVPAYLLGIVGVRLLSALRRNRALIWISAMNLVVDVVANIAFLRWFGLPGLALSTSLVYAASTTTVLLVVRSDLARKRAAPPTVAEV